MTSWDEEAQRHLAPGDPGPIAHVVKVQPWRFRRPGDSFDSCWVGWLYLLVPLAAMMGLVFGFAIGVLAS